MVLALVLSHYPHYVLNSAPNSEFSAEQQRTLRSLRATRIIPPILIGVGVVGYLFYRQFDPQEWADINWTAHTLLWIGISLTLLVVRHLAYASRLYILSEGSFTFKKSIELIFIWEFSSAVSPTSVGGSAVALFVLSQEKLSAGRTAALVLYTVVLDSAYFVLTLPIFYMLLGPMMVRPGATGIDDLGGWGLTFVIAYTLMAIYGMFICWGLFVSPQTIRKMLGVVAQWGWFKRFRKTLLRTGSDIVLASKHMRGKPLEWHLAAFGATAVAWSFRFLLLSCLFIGFTDVGRDWFTQTALYARLEAMFVIIAFSPTPGGAGFVETLFKSFLTDFVAGNTTSALVIATIWRLFTYYAYLFAGVIILPNWLRGVLARRAQKAKSQPAPVHTVETV